MSGAEVVRAGGHTDLTIAADQTGFTPTQVATLRQIGVEDASEGDLSVFFHQVVRTGLDPFARQIYMLGRRTRVNGQWVTRQTIQTGIDGFRLIARRSTDRAGGSMGFQSTEWCDQGGRWRDVWLSTAPPAAARVVVLRDGQPYPGLALWHEYAATKADGSLTSMWASKPALMLAKCAEALALRRAFPQDLAGLYTADEMAAADNDGPPPAVAQPEPIAEPVVMMSRNQSARMHVLFKELGIEDHGQQVAGISRVLGRAIESKTQMTEADAARVIDSLASTLDERRKTAVPAAEAQPEQPALDDADYDFPPTQEPQP